MINIDYIVGDSIAAGIAIGPFKLTTRSGHIGVKSTDAKGISKVGARPIEILGYLNEIGKEKFRGKNVIISTGLSNGSKDVANIEKQLQLLKDVDAKVYMIGVSNSPPDSLKVELVNSKLETLATKFGFTFFGGFAPSTDKVHPTSYTTYYNTAIKPVLSKVEDPASTGAASPAAAQSKSVIATGPGKDFINKFNEELEKVYKDATTSLGPWKKAREEAIKITKLRIGTWPVDPAVKTIGDLFAYVFFDLDGTKFNSPPWFQIKEDDNIRNDEVLQKQYNDWINDMNGAMPLPTSPTAPLVLDPTISDIFKSLAWPNKSTWTGKFRNSNLPIVLPKSKVIIENYNEIKKPGITNPDKYSAGQWWFDMFMSEVIGLNGHYGYLKSKSDGSNNERIEEAFGKSRVTKKFLDNNTKLEGDTNIYTISVSKFVKGEIPIISGTTSAVLDRVNYTEYGSGDQESPSGKEYPGYGFAKILELIERRQRGEYNFSKPPNIQYPSPKDGGGFDLFDSLKTQYRPGVNSLESLSKDPLFNPMRTSMEIDWLAVGITQSQETGIYWNYPVGTTASVVGNFENILLYNAFLEAGDDYKTITLPKYESKPKEESTVVSTLVTTTENKLSGEFTFNVEKKDTFVVVGNQNFTLKIGDLAIEGLTTSSVIESPKTIDLGDGVIIIDDGEDGEPDPYVENPYQGMDEEEIVAIKLSEQRWNSGKQEEEVKKNIENNNEQVALKDGTPIKDAKLSEKIVILIDTLIAGGYTLNQAAGIAGNVKAESGLVQFNVENGSSNIRPNGMGEKRWNDGVALGKNYDNREFSGIGLCQWTYGARYEMEKFVGKYLTDKGVKTSNLKNEFFDTDPSQFSNDYNKVYGGAGDVLEKHLSSVEHLYEAQCKFLVEYWLGRGKSNVNKNLKGGLSGNTATICGHGFFVNQSGGKPNTSTVGGACEIFLCDGEVPRDVGWAINKSAKTTIVKRKGKPDATRLECYHETVAQRTKCAMDILATYNSNKKAT